MINKRVSSSENVKDRVFNKESNEMQYNKTINPTLWRDIGNLSIGIIIVQLTNCVRLLF